MHGPDPAMPNATQSGKSTTSGRRGSLPAGSPMQGVQRDPSRRWLPYAVGALALVAYLPRCARTLALMGDSAELVTAAVIGGVPHAPGYPLYTAMGRLLTSVPLGDAVARLHATSALFHAGAVAAVANTVLTLTSSRGAAAAAGASLALSRSFLLGSLYAEVFPLHDLLYAVLLAIGARLGRTAKPRFRTLAGFAAVAGVAAAHHLMTALAVPALAWLAGPAFLRHFFPSEGRRKGGSTLVRAMALMALLSGPFLAGYPIMTHLARAAPLLSWGDVHDGASFVRIATRADYGGPFSAAARTVSGQALERLDLFFEIVFRSFGAVTLLGFAGGLLCLRRTTRHGGALLLAFVVPGPVFAVMNAFDVHSEYRAAYFERFTSMSQVGFAVLVGLGVVYLQSRLGRVAVVGRIAALSGLRRMQLAGLPWWCLMAPLTLHLDKADLHGDRTGISYARDLLHATPDDSVIFLAGDMAAHAALYACGVEKACADRVVFSPGQLHMAWVAPQLRRRYPWIAAILPTTRAPSSPDDEEITNMVARALEDHPVYLHPELVRRHPGLTERFALVPELLSWRVYRSQATMIEDPELATRCEAIAAEKVCAGCRAYRALAWRPSMQGQILAAYAEGLQRQSQFAAALGWTSRAERLARLASRFDGSR